MKAEKIFKGFMIFILTATFCFAPQKKVPEEVKGKSLIRIDLLVRKARDTAGPRRNIFAPQASLRQELFEEQATERNPQVSEALSKESTPPSLINLRYIGYIVSPLKIIGLVIFEDEALAVEEGETLSEGIKVGKITLEEIEIVGPGGASSKFPLEGEKE